MKAYQSVKIGNPLEDSTVCGPVHTKNAVKDYLHGLKTIQEQGGKIIVGGKQLEKEGNYIEPTSLFSWILKLTFCSRRNFTRCSYRKGRIICTHSIRY